MHVVLITPSVCIGTIAGSVELRIDIDIKNLNIKIVLFTIVDFSES